MLYRLNYEDFDGATCLKELCKICSVVLRHVNLDSLAESRRGTAGSALTLHHIKQNYYGRDSCEIT